MTIETAIQPGIMVTARLRRQQQHSKVKFVQGIVKSVNVTPTGKILNLHNNKDVLLDDVIQVG